MALTGIMIDQVAKTNPNPQKLNTTTSLVNKAISTPAGTVSAGVPTTKKIVSNTPESVMSINVKNGATTGNGGTYNAGYGTNASLKASTASTVPLSNNQPTNTNVEKNNAGTSGMQQVQQVQQTSEPVQQVEEETPTTTTKKSSSGSSSSIYSMIQSMYETQRQQAIAEIQRAMEKAVANYQDQIDNLGQNYDPLRNQSEYERYKSEQALKEQLANGGNMYSGLGRQEQLNLQNNYSNALNDINMQQQNELDTLNKAIADAQQEGAYQKANAGYNYDIANYNAMINQANDDRDYTWKQYLQQYQEQQDALKNKYNYGGTTADSITPKSTSSSNTSSLSTLNKAVNNQQVYEGIENDLDAYYDIYGFYPSTTNTKKAIQEYNKLVNEGKTFSQSEIYNWLQNKQYNGEISDLDVEILRKHFGL